MSVGDFNSTWHGSISKGQFLVDGWSFEDADELFDLAVLQKRVSHFVIEVQAYADEGKYFCSATFRSVGKPEYEMSFDFEEFEQAYEFGCLLAKSATFMVLGGLK